MREIKLATPKQRYAWKNASLDSSLSVVRSFVMVREVL